MAARNGKTERYAAKIYTGKRKAALRMSIIDMGAIYFTLLLLVSTDYVHAKLKRFKLNKSFKISSVHDTDSSHHVYLNNLKYNRDEIDIEK